MVEFALKVTIVIFITEIIIVPVKIFTEAAASVASTVATALVAKVEHVQLGRLCRKCMGNFCRQNVKHPFDFVVSV